MTGGNRSTVHPILEPFYRLLADLKAKVSMLCLLCMTYCLLSWDTCKCCCGWWAVQGLRPEAGQTGCHTCLPAVVIHLPGAPPAYALQVGDEEGAVEARRQANECRLNQRLSQVGKQQGRAQKSGTGANKRSGGGTGASTARAGGRRV